jgi:hypothetical protein
MQLWFKFLRSVLNLRIFRGMHVDQVELPRLGCDARFTTGFQSVKALRRFAAEPVNGMSPHFVRDAVRNGDACYAVCEGATLVSSAWYSTRPTPIGAPGLVLHFAPGYVYMYKGLTCETYRGQRLYAVGISRALAHYTAQGSRGFVSYVEATNLASMKAALRMGFRVFGSVYLIRLFGRHFAFSSPGCRAFGFRLETTRLVQRASRRDRPERFNAPRAHAHIPVV